MTIPARNEELLLPQALEALRQQVDLNGTPLTPESFEVILLLNNCTDHSAAVARSWQARHPAFPLHVVERTFREGEAHAGTARKLLMDAAANRLGDDDGQTAAILSTDADTEVAPDWIARNLQALERGADAVGGRILLRETDLATLPERVRRAYEQDRRYAALVAELEDILDPQTGDPWPRHLDHFGSSLACTPKAYALAGGMAAAATLEDEDFVTRLRRACLHLRHEPAVRVFTSGRLHGRTSLGLAKQFRCWEQMHSDRDHTVRSARFVAHRFRTLRLLRETWRTQDPDRLPGMPDEWRRWVLEVLPRGGSVTDFFSVVDSDGLVAQGFVGAFEEPIADANGKLEQLLDELRGTATNRPSNNAARETAAVR